MLVLILINVQYLQKVVFSFEKGLNAQNHSSGSHHLIKKSDRHHSISIYDNHMVLRDHVID